MGNIKLKCPNCGAVLIVVDDPANVSKSIICPVCKRINRYLDYMRIESRNTIIDENNRTPADYRSNDETVIINRRTEPCQGLLIADNRKVYRLDNGLNVIGRKSEQSFSLANVAIDTSDLGFSRKHLFIDVSTSPDGDTRFYAFNADNKNLTFINGHVLKAADKMVLHNNDIIKSSDTVLKFIISKETKSGKAIDDSVDE